MPETLPIELRHRVVRAYEEGDESYAAVAMRFSVGEASVKRWAPQVRRRAPVLPPNAIRARGFTPRALGALHRYGYVDE